jgi:hypothetical protein
MRKCSKCQEEKPLDQFGKKDKNRLQNYCKECNKIRCREYYANNKDILKPQINLARKKRTNKIRDYIRDLKSKTPCTDCHKNYPYYVMDFDHQHSKKFLISQAPTHGMGLDLIKQEIDKCEIVCANCHRIRTFNKSKDL